MIRPSMSTFATFLSSLSSCFVSIMLFFVSRLITFTQLRFPTYKMLFQYLQNLAEKAIFLDFWPMKFNLQVQLREPSLTSRTIFKSNDRLFTIFLDSLNIRFTSFSPTWDSSLPTRLNQDLQREDGMYKILRQLCLLSVRSTYLGMRHLKGQNFYLVYLIDKRFFTVFSIGLACLGGLVYRM